MINQPTFEYENKYRQLGYKLIAGVDEAGRGCICGPVVAACVILPLDFDGHEINDSKQLSSTKRNKLAQRIKKEAIAYSVAFISAAEIDKINILQASKKAMNEAIANLKIKPDFVLTDAMLIDAPHLSIIKGDQKSISVAAASILAKTARDEYMINLDKLYPQYGFAQNKGYPTKLHLAKLNECGFIKEHRKTFQPVSKAKIAKK